TGVRTRQGALRLRPLTLQHTTFPVCAPPLFSFTAVMLFHEALKNKRDRNKTMTGKARIFRVSTAFTGLFPEKSAGNVFPCQRAYCAHLPERFHALIKEQFYVPYQYDRNGEHLPFLDCSA
ncbi:MAG: hypothetical protein IKN96_08645, partial [Oscillibacter sp.]|nr:hypothetical protein [Oscillibacter sp.]